MSYTKPNKMVRTVNGTVVQILHDQIIVEMEDKANIDTKWNVKFSPNRTTVKMEQQALQIIANLGLSRFFFPIKPEPKGLNFNEFQWINENITSNSEQMLAIKNIVNETAFPAPYILFGPPGTGKTSTLVEAIGQIYRLKPEARILVSATSNFACNEIASRLLKVIPKNYVFRFFSKSAERLILEMSYDLIERSNLNTGSHRFPSWDEIYGTRVLICTLTSAGRLIQGEIKQNHFSFVFIDECGSATEASSLIPIAGIITEAHCLKGSIILSGDPMQLGPIIRSTFAEKMGLGVSMLERLMNHNIYEKDANNAFNPLLITKLVKNYRSHKDILNFSNVNFYTNELLPVAKSENVNWALNWYLLPSRWFPIIFESVIGSFLREEDSTSYYNRKEIDTVTYYLETLLRIGVNGRQIMQSEIGVISPYKKQCIKIRQECSRRGWNGIEVGSVEQYQGREKPVIILSTVRSKTRSVGFLDNVKRLNVALTRAKALLIIIGNPETLQKDENWSKFIQYCHANDAIRGNKFELKLTVDENNNNDENNNDIKDVKLTKSNNCKTD